MFSSMFQLKRWADRKGRTVKWGNIVGPYIGQEFEEKFSTTAEAKERERQVNALEPIGDTREPVPISRKRLR